MLTRNIGGKLHEQAGLAQPDVQWIEDLGLVKPVGGNIALAQRRHSQINECMRKIRAA